MKKMIGIKRKKDRGYTLLEYCAGAAIITGIIWGAMSAMGSSVGNLLQAVGNWAQSRTSSITQQ